MSEQQLMYTVLYISAVVHPWVIGCALILLDKEGWGRGANSSNLAGSKLLGLVEVQGRTTADVYTEPSPVLYISMGPSYCLFIPNFRPCFLLPSTLWTFQTLTASNTCFTQFFSQSFFILFCSILVDCNWVQV
jgi:hypothetical protein